MVPSVSGRSMFVERSAPILLSQCFRGRFDRIEVIRRYRSELQPRSSDSDGNIRVGHRPSIPASRFAPNRAHIDVIAPDDDPNSRADDPVSSPGLDYYFPCIRYLLKLLCGQRHWSRLGVRPHAGPRPRRVDQVEPVFGSQV